MKDRAWHGGRRACALFSRTQCPRVLAKPGQLNAPKTVLAVPHLTFELAKSAKLLQATRHQVYKNLGIL